MSACPRSLRSGRFERRTEETDVEVAVLLAPSAAGMELDTPLPFLNHMLDQLARHGGLGLQVRAAYTGESLSHHLVEDVGIALGRALDQALGDRRGIQRFGWALVPMDEVLVEAAVDLSGRGAFHGGNLSFSAIVTEGYDTAHVAEFFRAVAANARLTLHLDLRRHGNPHHEVEGCHKVVAQALRQAVSLRGIGIEGCEAGSTEGSPDLGVPSTKGVL